MPFKKYVSTGYIKPKRKFKDSKPRTIDDDWITEPKKVKKKLKTQKVRHKRKAKSVNTKFPNTDHLKGQSYQVFLDSRYWKIVRQMVLKRDKYACVICKSTTFLQVHHDTYKHHFKEHLHLEDLMTLCRECHKEHHYAQL